MGYTSPAFMVRHPSAEITLAKITLLPNASSLSDDSKRALVDRRQGELAQFSATAADAGIIFSHVDIAAPRMNHAVMPSGHNLGGFTLVLQSDDNEGLSSVAQRFSVAVSGSGVFDEAFTLQTTETVWLFNLPGSMNGQVFTMGEFWLGERVAIATADVQPFFEREWVHRIAKRVIGGRDLSLELTPPRRRFGLSLRYVDPGSADFTILEEVMRLGVSTPFWYWPPDSTDPGPYLVKLERSATRRQERVAPQVTISYSIDLVMIEQTT